MKPTNIQFVGGIEQLFLLSIIILYFTFTVSRISPLNAHRQCYGEVLYISNTIPTSQNCLITNLRARGLNKHPLGNCIFSPNVALEVLRLINLGFSSPQDFNLWVVDIQNIEFILFKSIIVFLFFQTIITYYLSIIKYFSFITIHLANLTTYRTLYNT